MIEEEDAASAGDVREDEGFDFRVVVLRDAGVGGEVCFGAGGKGSQGGEGVGVEGEVGFFAANVLNGNGEVGVAEVALGLAFGGCFDVVEGFGVVRGWGVEFEGGGDGAAGDVRSVMGRDGLGWVRGGLRFSGGGGHGGLIGSVMREVLF